MAASSKLVIPIGGMSCKHCVASVTGALSSLPGVTGVDVYLEKGLAEITGDDLDVAAIRAAIEDLGFDAGEPI